MDEILFRLSSQLETLQIQTSVTVQHLQQLLSTWLAQSSRLLQNTFNDLHGQEFKESLHHLLTWFHQQVKTLAYHLYSVRISPGYIYHQLGNFYTLEVSRRELFYFITGILTGTLIGYSIALNWNVPRHLHPMKAIVCHHYLNGVEGVSLVEDAEMPVIQKSNEILIQVKAASIHEVDLKICSGYSKFYRRLLNNGRYKDVPVILGRDCAGVVVDIGHEVVNFDIGDKVFLAVPSWASGTMAEYIVVPETQVAKMPKVLPFEASASLPYSGCIAWDALVNNSIINEGNAQGRRVLVYGGSTPVGCIIIQLIKLWGGSTVAICKPQAAPVVKALGANDVILLHGSDVLKELELSEKFDAIFYTGGHLVDKKILKRFLLPHGSYVSTVPENLISDSLGYLTGSLFSGFIRIRLLIQYAFASSIYHWNDGIKLNTVYLQSIQKLADADQLHPILDKVYAPNWIDQALSHVMSDVNAIGSTVIKFH
ncbi:reticulon-4-interacting protein 1 homolog, mitochondrial-like [Copidosoma floridanum]|uniref:reticulon-4-interacting protein 1 homolog, mitochondrial-like n=1 Tax=Copidosoma floridanum TaxID=29053 RepID=UPI0006C9B1A1|nr:reticulon-4-interacting protein 1 homolog, mitochondrial-like [Copidosoma floridanum]